MAPPSLPATGPLHGIRVLDLTTIVLGPYATQILGDYGAEVIKVESPEGDLMRANGVARHPGMSSIFLAINRNKRSIVLDLKKPEGRRVFLELAAGVDVVVHNMRVAAIDRLGLGYEAAQQANPRIVYCAATGFGQNGPHRAKPSFDDIVQAASGLASLVGGHDSPAYVPALIADKTAGMALVNAMLAALLHRERTGQGQYVEVPMFETLVEFNLAEHLGGLSFEPPLGGAGYARIASGGRRPLRTADGHVAVLPYNPAQWVKLFRHLGREDVLERHPTRNRHELNASVRQMYAELAAEGPKRTTAQWMDICDQLDLPGTPIYNLDDLPNHPHLKAVGMFQLMQHPSEGAVRYVRPAVRFTASPASVRLPAPQLGQDTASVLAGLGYSGAEIAALEAAGAITIPPAGDPPASAS